MSDYIPSDQIAPNYSRPEIDEVTLDRLRKPARGQRILDREAAAAEALKLEREQKGIAKKRDVRCRWPEKHVCRGGELEAAHIVDASLGGPMDAKNLITTCPWIHRRGPESIHGKQLKVEAETERGAWGPLSFHRQTGEFDDLGQPVYHCIAIEDAPGVVRKGER